MSLEAKDNKTLIGRNLRNLRLSKEMTLNEVAAASGFSISFLSQVEKGTRSIKPADLKSVLTACGFSLCIFMSHVQKDIAQFPLNAGDKKRIRENFVLLDGERNGADSIFLTAPVFENTDAITLEINIAAGSQTNEFVLGPSRLSLYAAKNSFIMITDKKEEFLSEGEAFHAEAPLRTVLRNPGKEPCRAIITLDKAAF